MARLITSEWDLFYEKVIPEGLGWTLDNRTEYYMHAFAAQKINFSFFLEKSDHKFFFAIHKQEGLVSTQRNK